MSDCKDKKEEFERAALPHMNSLYCAALHMTKSKEKAEDLVQETYLKAYRSFESFEKGTNCKAWLFKILRNSFINKYHREIKSPAAISFDEIADFYIYNRLSKEEPALKVEERLKALEELFGDEVMDALENLPAEFREAIMLSDVEDFTYEEISKIADVPIGTVKSRLYRARRHLQKNLWDYAIKRRLIRK